MSRRRCGLRAPGQRACPIQLRTALLLLPLLLLQLCTAHQADRFLRDLPQYEVVHPTRVNARGHFLSNFLSPHARRVQRRDAPGERAEPERVFYGLWHAGRRLSFNLTLNRHLLAPGFLTERRYGGLDGARIRPATAPRCHFLGEVWDAAAVRGSAAISACDGLTGLFKLSDEEFFIQPLETARDDTSAPQAHAIYKRHVSPPPPPPPPPPRPPPPPPPPPPPSSWTPVVRPISGKQAANATCGVTSSLEAEMQRERWERRQQRRRRRLRQRSVSREKWVETLVVADSKMVDYHGSKAVESYVLAVMNIVAGLYKDASIGNAVNIVIVRLILLEEDEDDLKITHHADNSLNSFCKWQKKLNMKGDDHPLHHDVAVLLTRKDICTSINAPCETLGLSHVAGMCQPHRSCSISEDTGLPLAFTVAHEMGHNFGIQHDGHGNDCEPIGKRPFVMSPQLLYGTALPRWSRCSRQYITRFLDRGWGWCLDDPPVKDRLSLTSVPPGVLYSALHQCRLQYGSGSRLCDDMDNVCSTLWCTMGTTCHSKLDGAVDGTSCGENKWCFGGECVAVGFHPDSVHGGWGSWSEWSPCSRTCGAGVRSAERDCDSPVPKYRGRYCLGERRRYRMCNTAPCAQERPSFRDIQCSHFNTLPYKGKLYHWEAVINRVNPCELHCRPLNEHFSEKMRDAVTDGTPCYEGNKSRDMCINGICKKIGCDYVIDSTAVEDRCGVCHGNGSTCKTVRRTFDESEGLGYVDIGLIPEGAWDIRVQEVAEAGNFLALRSDEPDRYFLNGGWTIQWTGDYKAAGTVFTYERTGHLEHLTSPGPTMEPLWIQLLFQEKNPGVRYEYTVSRNASEHGGGPATAFAWKFGSWTECSATCGTGVQRQIVHCVEKTTGIVEERFCDPSARPDNNQTSCSKDPCPAVWWVGDWQKCSASCGSSGLMRRAVVCVQAVSEEEQQALEPSDCQHIPKPVSESSCNTHVPCPADWTTSTWSKCSLTCGSGVRQRNVTCSRNTGVDCDPLKRPLAVAPCYAQDCPQLVDNFGSVDWSGSGWSSKEVLNEINPISRTKPPAKHGAAKAPPRSHNHIVEGDFHYHNNLEDVDSSQENPVRVDDFYYDYNFINFHEDLSDDFEGEEKDSEDGNADGVPQVDETPPSGEEKTLMETTGAPTDAPSVSTVPRLAGSTLEAEKLQDPKAEDTKDGVDVGADESENLFDFLAEDHLLPVATTRSPPPPSTTQPSQTVRGEHVDLRGPEDVSAAPRLVFTSNPPAQDVKQDPYEEESSDYNSSEDEDRSEDVAVMLTPGYRATVATTTETEERDDYVDESEEETDGPGYSYSTTSGTLIPGETEVWQEERASEIPQSVGQSTSSPVTFTLGDHHTQFHRFSPASEGNFQDTDLRATPPPGSEKPTRLPPPISGNPGVSGGSAATTGTEITPPTDLEGVSHPPFPDVYRPAPTSQDATGTDSPSHFDYNDIVLPPTPRRRADTPSSELPAGTEASPGYSTTPTQHTASTPPPVPISPPHPAVQWPRPSSTPVQTPALGAAYWVAGNWSACSTTCGLGATWRPLTCSTGSESDCDPVKRPVPAQRCYLRPCATWKVGEWSKCSRNCDGSFKSREVLCFDLRDQRPLRPFHCRAMSSRPPAQAPCNPQPCLQWFTSSWGQCSEVCGGGEQQRIVTCPEADRCDGDLQPSNIQPCNSQPCAQWLTGSWGQCSASCGGGVQHRLIQCVDTKAETDEVLDSSQCDRELQPESSQKCNRQDCESAPSACLRDRLTLRFCQTLRWLGRCRLPNVRAQCCKSCGLTPHAGATAASLHRGRRHQLTTHTTPHQWEH